MGDRRAEQRHHGVADELLDGPAEALELGPQLRVVRREQAAHVLRVERLRAGGEADEVGEEDAHDLALLTARAVSGRGQLRAAERAIRERSR